MQTDRILEQDEDSDPALDRVFQFLEDADNEGWDNTEILMAMQSAISLIQHEFNQATMN